MVNPENNGKGCLIVYSSLAGCTEEVALKIKEKLENSSVKTEIVKINEIDQFKSLSQRDLGPFSSILLGSSIAIGKVHKNFDEFLAKLESTPLNGRKLGFFICCMKVRNPGKVIEAKNEYLEPTLKKYNLHFSIVDAFGGKVDCSPTSSLNLMVMGILKKKMLADYPDLKEIEPKVYDFRDWQQIEQFASSWLSIIGKGQG